MRSRWLLLFFAASCGVHVASSEKTLLFAPPVAQESVRRSPPPIVELPPYKRLVVKPLSQAVEEPSPVGPPSCEPNKSVFCKEAEYKLLDGRTVVVTKRPKTMEKRLFVYEFSDKLDRVFHSNKRTKAGLPLRWKGQPFQVVGMVTLDEYFVLVGSTLPKRGQGSKRFQSSLILKRYNANSGDIFDLPYTTLLRNGWHLQFVRVLNQTKWVMGIQMGDDKQRKDAPTTVVVCHDWQCAQVLKTKPYFHDGELLRDHHVPLHQDRLLWMNVGEGQEEQIVGFSSYVTFARVRYAEHEVMLEPKIKLPRLPMGAQWLALETIQDRAVYIAQNADDLNHIKLGCVELSDQKPCEGTRGGYYLIALSQPEKVHRASIELSGDGYLQLELDGQDGGKMDRFAIGLPATREQLRLVEHPEEVVLWWRNIGSQDKPQPSLLATAKVENLKSLSLDMKERLQEEKSILPNDITVPPSLLRAWAVALLTQHELDRPTYPSHPKGRRQVGDFYLYALQLCQGLQCWERVPSSRKEISDWADIFLKEIPQESVPELRQTIQRIQALGGTSTLSQAESTKSTSEKTGCYKEVPLSMTTAPATQAAVLDRSHFLVSSDNRLRVNTTEGPLVLSTTDGTFVAELDPTPRDRNQLAFLGEGAYVWTTYWNRLPGQEKSTATLSIWETTKGTLVFQKVFSYITGVTESPNHQYVLIGTQDNPGFYVVGIPTFAVTPVELESANNVTRGPVFSADGQCLLKLEEDHVKIYDLTTHRMLQPLSYPDFNRLYPNEPDQFYFDQTASYGATFEIQSMLRRKPTVVIPSLLEQCHRKANRTEPLCTEKRDSTGFWDGTFFRSLQRVVTVSRLFDPEEAVVSVWRSDVASEKPLYSFLIPSGFPWVRVEFSLSPLHRLLVVYRQTEPKQPIQKRLLELHDFNSGKLLQTIDVSSSTGLITSAEFSPAEDTLTIHFDDSSSRIWKECIAE